MSAARAPRGPSGVTAAPLATTTAPYTTRSSTAVRAGCAAQQALSGEVSVEVCQKGVRALRSMRGPKIS
ncbi:hypothetical protein ACFYYH_15940 [Streptomyces sp. NPDC002018]|uniref:hypothetical protein n=1 Tax=Streptomyces sp. NPDC002018 TaxID=3364629 RepID=UPI0036BC1FC9